MPLTGINWASRPTVQLVADINGGAGPASTHQASNAWHELSAVLTAADDDFNQTMTTAMGSWEGPGAESAQASLSPFSEWAATAQAIARELNLQTEGHVGAFTATRVSMPSMPEVLATEAVKDNMLDKAVGLLTGIPTPGEVAEVVAAEQQLQSAAAMTFYDAAASRFTEYTPFLPAPLLTVAVVPTSTSSGAVAYNGLGAHYSQDYTSTMTAGAGGSAGTVGAGSSGGTHSAHAGGTGSAAGNSSGGSLVSGAHSGGAVGGGASNGSHSQSTGSYGSGSSGSSFSGGSAAAHGGGSPAGTARTYSAASSVSGPAGTESGSHAERGLAAGSGAGSVGHGEAGRSGGGPSLGGGLRDGGLRGRSSGGIGAFAPGSGAGGSFSSGGGAGGSGGSGGAGSVSSASDTATRGSLSSSTSGGGGAADGGARGLGNAGSTAAGGRGGVGSGAGAGGGRSEEDQEHETPDYLKDLEHFSDGRVVAPPVIGVDDVS